jgi:hypothetical protein
MRFARIIANLIVGIALAVILVGLVCIIIDERCGRNVSADDTAGIEQIDFKPGAWREMK